MVSSVPTRVFFRDVYARTQTEVQACLGFLTARELNFVDISPQQRAWLLGARCALSWVLGMPKGGAMIAKLIDGVATPGVVSIGVADDFMAERRRVQDGLYDYSTGNFNSGG